MEKQANAVPGLKTILMVDDNESVRTAIAKVLEMYGYHVIQASRGREALEFSKNSSDPIDLMITDMVMPFMSGLELTKALKARRPETKVLVMSGYVRDSVELLDHLDSDVAMIQKPVPISVLLRKIREVLDGVVSLVPAMNC